MLAALLLLWPVTAWAQLFPIPNTPTHVICDAGTCGGGSAFNDGAVFTGGSTPVNIFAGIFNDGLADLTSGTAAAARVTAKRALHINLRDANGVELGTLANALAIRCVNTAGTAYEACGGSGGAGGSGDGAILDGTTATIKATVVTDASSMTGLEHGLAVAMVPGQQPVTIQPSGGFVSARIQAFDGSNYEASSGTPAGTESAMIVRNIPSGTQTVSGTVTANAGTGTFAVSGPLTDTQLRASAVPVSGTFWQATQPVSGPLTDTQLRATAVPVSGTFWQTTQPVSGTVTANAGTGTFTVAGTVTSNQGTANTTANAWPIKLTDGTDSANITGTALDVNCTAGCAGGASETSTTATWTSATALNTALTLTTTNYGAGTMQIVMTGSVTAGTITFEASNDGGTTWVVLPHWWKVCTLCTGAAYQTTTSWNSGNDVTSVYAASLGAFNSYRARLSQAVTGTGSVAVRLVASAVAPTAQHVYATAALPITASTPLDVNNKQINGITLSTSNGVSDTGTQRVILAQDATYSAGMTAATNTAAGTGVFWEMCGSATKTVRVQKIVVSGTVATGAKNGDVVLAKRSAASTGGTATTLTQFPLDSNSAAATAASSKFYTVLATAGTLTGVVQDAHIYLPLTGTGTLSVPVEFVWKDPDAESPTLRGTSQCLSLNFGTSTTNAPALMVSAKWTEK